MKVAPLPPDEAQRLEALHSYKVLDTTPETDLDELTELASLICETPISLVSLVDAHRQWFKSRVGVDVSETSRDVAFCAHGILQDEVFEVPDAHQDERFHDNPLVTGAPGVRFYAGVPLRAPDGHNLGMLCVNDHVPRRLNSNQRRALEVLAARVVGHLELTRTSRQLRRSNRHAMMLMGILRTYTPRDVWQRLRADTTRPDRPYLVGERLRRAFLFADISGFTPLANRNPPERVAELASACLGRVVNGVHAQGGDVEKFIGDCVFAVLPDAGAAVRAARSVQAEFRRDPVVTGEDREVRLQLSIGIHSGEAVRAHLGTEQRRDNTLIGEAVNLAARLQAAAGRGQTLLSHQAWLEAGQPPQLSHDEIAVKGMEGRVGVHILDVLTPWDAPDRPV